MRRVIALLCIFFLTTVLVDRPSSAEEGVLDLFVTNTSEMPLAGAILSPRGAGSVSPPTDKTGRTRIKLTRGAKPGKRITLQLIKGPAGTTGWYLISPWKGRTTIPALDDEDPDNYITIVIARSSDKLVLKNVSAMVEVAGGILLEEAASLETARPTSEARKLVLAAQAELMGTGAEELNQAIRSTIDQTKDSYERGLLALYNGTYSSAVVDLSEFLQKSPKQSDRTRTASFFLGRAYQAAGDYQKAIDAYRKSEPNVLYLSSLAQAYKLAGDETNAEAVFREALRSDATEEMGKAQLLANLRRIYGPEKQRDKLATFYAVAESSLDREFFKLIPPPSSEGHGFTKGGENEKLIANLSQAITETVARGDKRSEAKYLTDLGSVYLWSRDYKNALESYQRAEPILAELEGKREQAKNIVGIAASYQFLKQYDKALEYFTKALSIIQTLDNQQLETFAMQRMGVAYLGLGQYDNAIKIFEQTAAAIRANLGADDPSLTYPVSGLVYAYFKKGQYENAERLVNAELSMREKALGPNNDYVAFSLVDLGELFRQQKKYSQAEESYRRALTILEKSTSREQSAYLYRVLSSLASVLEEQNKVEDLHSLYENAIAHQGPGTEPEKALLLARNAKLYAKEQKIEEAQRLYKLAVEIIRSSARERSDLTEILKEYVAFLKTIQKETEAAKIEALVRERSSGRP